MVYKISASWEQEVILQVVREKNIKNSDLELGLEEWSAFIKMQWKAKYVGECL